MSANARSLAAAWMRVAPRFLPFADAASADLPLARLARLALFQISVGMAIALLYGTVNRVMIVELGVTASLVAAMIALPVLIAPFRALIGFRSDTHRSALGWRRTPYIWFGTLLQFGGLAILPFSLLILSGDTHGPVFYGQAAAALAFVAIGAGFHVTQTAGLALATDLAPPASRPRVVALLYVMLLVGMLVSSFLFGWLLDDFNAIKLIKVIQGAAVATVLLNLAALWKQEALDRRRAAERDRPRGNLRQAWRAFAGHQRYTRLLVAIGLGTAGFSMQDILLEPYGGEVLGLSVAATTALTGLFALGILAACALAARRLARGANPCRLAALGALVGIAAFSAVVFSDPLGSALLFRAGTVLIGVGTGLFAVGTLTAAMAAAPAGVGGLVLGAWGAVQATATGVGIALGGFIRDLVGGLAEQGTLGAALTGPGTGYSVVYHIEIGLLFLTLVAIGPLVRRAPAGAPRPSTRFGLAEFPA